MSKNRAKNWASDERIEDGYQDAPFVNKNRNSEDKRHDSLPSPLPVKTLSATNPKKMALLKKCKVLNRRNGEPYVRPLAEKIIHSSHST